MPLCSRHEKLPTRAITKYKGNTNRWRSWTALCGPTSIESGEPASARRHFPFATWPPVRENLRMRSAGQRARDSRGLPGSAHPQAHLGTGGLTTIALWTKRKALLCASEVPAMFATWQKTLCCRVVTGRWLVWQSRKEAKQCALAFASASSPRSVWYASN